MNQGKLDMVKQEMARVNIDILGISELKWMGMGEFNSNDLYIYSCGQESLRRNGVALIVHNKELSSPNHSAKAENLCFEPTFQIVWQCLVIKVQKLCQNGII